MLEGITNRINNVLQFRVFGRVRSINGLMVEVEGLEGAVAVGTKCHIVSSYGTKISAEVTGIRSDSTILMPFSDLQGVSSGCRVEVDESSNFIYPSDAWLGRVVNALGVPVDDKGPIETGKTAYLLKNSPPSAHRRRMVEGKLDLGVRSVNTFTTCCHGQRMGVFAGSGVGKSVLISMLTKYSEADVKVIGLVGERGRELQEFLHKYLGEEGLKNAVVIAATSDESALMRRQAAYLTMTIAEYFRDQGKEVLCLIDSVTRFAMAQREIGLASGEPPATRGYTPSVFAEMPKLLERAGPGTASQGNITGLFTVLVEGDDQNEPISDTVRGILDGHIVLERRIAERGRFPAVNVLRSISRTMPGCNTKEQNELVTKARRILAVYEDMSELIRLGAYRKGSDPEVDEAIKYTPKLEEFMRQLPNESSTLEECYTKLKEILSS